MPDLSDFQIDVMKKVLAEPGVRLTSFVPEHSLSEAQELAEWGLIDGRSVAITLGAEHGVRLYLTERGRDYCKEHLDV